MERRSKMVLSFKQSSSMLGTSASLVAAAPGMDGEASDAPPLTLRCV